MTLQQNVLNAIDRAVSLRKYTYVHEPSPLEYTVSRHNRMNDNPARIMVTPTGGVKLYRPAEGLFREVRHT